MQRITVKIPINFGTLSCNFISFLILKPIFLINWDKILFELFCCAFDETIAVLKCFKSPDTLVLCGVKWNVDPSTYNYLVKPECWGDGRLYVARNKVFSLSLHIHVDYDAKVDKILKK